MIDRTSARAAVKTIFGCERRRIARNVILVYLDKKEDYRPYFKKIEAQFDGWVSGFTGIPKEGSERVSVIKTTQFFIPDCAFFLRYTPCRNLIYVGAIGGRADTRIGEIIIPESAYVGEGFSQYFSKRRLARASETLTSELTRQFGGHRLVRNGRIFTTSAFCAESAEWLGMLERKGFVGIEMETSALFTLGEKFSIRVAAAHFVSDLPAKHSFTRKETKKEHRMMEEAKKLIRQKVTGFLGNYKK